MKLGVEDKPCHSTAVFGAALGADILVLKLGFLVEIVAKNLLAVIEGIVYR